jgi:hypothetical protein
MRNLQCCSALQQLVGLHPYQVSNRQKDTLAKLAAFTDKLRHTNKQQQQRAAPVVGAGREAVAELEDAAAGQLKAAGTVGMAAPVDAADGGAADGGEEAYDGKVSSHLLMSCLLFSAACKARLLASSAAGG